MQTKELMRSLIAAAQRLTDALHQCGLDYVKLANSPELFDPKTAAKLLEAKNTSDWVFEQYRKNYSLTFRLLNYYVQPYTYDELYELISASDDEDDLNLREIAAIPESQIEYYLKRLSTSEVLIPLILCNLIDYPLGLVASAVGYSIKLSVNSPKLIGDALFHLIRSNLLPHYASNTRESHFDLLTLQATRLGFILSQPTINCRELALTCQGVINDLRKLTQATSSSSVTVGEYYMTTPMKLTGMKHFITGRSRLAQLLDDNVLKRFDFTSESQMLNLGQDIFIPENCNRIKPSTSPEDYPKVRFFSNSLQTSNELSLVLSANGTPSSHALHLHLNNHNNNNI